MQGKKAATILLLLTTLNLLVLVFRDSFQYQPYAGYKELYAECGENCREKWAKYRDDYPANELREARRITDSVLLGQPADEYSKALAIGSFLYNRFYKQLGKPTEELLSSTPLAQYKKLCSSDSVQLWCGNLAQIFSYFCWSQGMICRNIEIMKPGDHHLLNEVYLPSAAGWMMVDLTNNQLSVKNERDTVVNLVNYRRLIRAASPLIITRAVSDNGKMEKIRVPEHSSLPEYFRNDYALYYYHQVDNSKVYTFKNKIARYFLPISWYDIFDEKVRSNALFYLKLTLILLWIISFFVFIRTRTKFRI